MAAMSAEPAPKQFYPVRPAVNGSLREPGVR